MNTALIHAGWRVIVMWGLDISAAAWSTSLNHQGINTAIIKYLMCGWHVRSRYLDKAGILIMIR